MSLSTLVSKEKLTGGTRDTSLISEIKDSADHAGLLLPQLLTKAIRFSSMASQRAPTSQNNNWLIVQLKSHTKIMVAMED